MTRPPAASVLYRDRGRKSRNGHRPADSASPPSRASLRYEYPCRFPDATWQGPERRAVRQFPGKNAVRHNRADLKNTWIAGGEGASVFPYPFRRQVFQFTRMGHLAHQRQSFIGNTKTEVGITRTKRATRRTRNGSSPKAWKHGQQTILDIAETVAPVDNLALIVLASALMVRSRRLRSSSSVTSGAA